MGACRVQKFRIRAEATPRKEKLLAEEAERKALQKNDFFNQKGKDRKPRASGSDESAAE